MSYRVSYRSGGGLNLGPIGFLIIINLILYVATSIKPDLFIGLFGLSRMSFPGQWWTVITSMFIHAPFPNFWHILFNMLTLYFFGNYLISLVNERNFLITYFLGGLLGSFSFLLLSSPFSIAIGASGAVFSLAGALTVLRPRLKVFIIPIPIPIPLWVASIIFVMLSFSVGIAWQAHLGGIVFGVIIGYIFKRRQRGIIFNF